MVTRVPLLPDFNYAVCLQTVKTLICRCAHLRKTIGYRSDLSSVTEQGSRGREDKPRVIFVDVYNIKYNSQSKQQGKKMKDNLGPNKMDLTVQAAVATLHCKIATLAGVTIS